MKCVNISSVVVLLCLSIFTSDALMAGGAQVVTAENEEAWNRIKGYVAMISDDVYTTLEKNEYSIEMYELCGYPLVAALQQVVSGMNYFVKISLCDESYVHIYFYVQWGADSEPQIEAIQYPKQLHDTLRIFRTNHIVPKRKFYY